MQGTWGYYFEILANRHCYCGWLRDSLSITKMSICSFLNCKLQLPCASHEVGNHEVTPLAGRERIQCSFVQTVLKKQVRRCGLSIHRFTKCIPDASHQLSSSNPACWRRIDVRYSPISARDEASHIDHGLNCTWLAGIAE